MICVHLKELYSLCEQHDLRLGGSDLIRIICKQCEQEETCPSMLLDDYETIHPDEDAETPLKTAGDSQEEIAEKGQDG